MLSRKSRQRLAFIANNTHVQFKTMITLTYPSAFPGDGKDVKNHLDTFLKWTRRYFAKPSYLWFLEFQKRGAPHIHILLDSPLPQTVSQRSAVYAIVAAEWYKVVGSHDPRHGKAGTRCERIRKPDGAARYCLKYAYKTKQKCVPDAFQNVGRFWGCSRGVTPAETRTVPIDELSVRAIIADWEFSPNEDTLVYQTLFGCAERFRNYSGVRVWADLTNVVLCDKLPLSGSSQTDSAIPTQEVKRWARSYT